MKTADPREVLKRFVEVHPNRKLAASALGIKEAYLSQLLTGRAPFSDRMLQELGLKQIVVKS